MIQFCWKIPPYFQSPKKKYKKSPAQIALRFQVQRGVAVIPKSATPQRLKDNLDVFNFTISESDMNVLRSMQKNFRYCIPHLTNSKGERVPEITADHPENPFLLEF